LAITEIGGLPQRVHIVGQVLPILLLPDKFGDNAISKNFREGESATDHLLRYKLLKKRA